MEVVKFSASDVDVMMRSIVDLWPEHGSILVPRSLGVMREASG